ncbi:MAG: membrane protein [Pirellulaceae bacterium]|nr:MAG: membrane protein [Pirellulaceae bacterium]
MTAPPIVLAEIVLGAQDWWLFVGMLVAAVSLLVAWSYYMRGGNSGLRALAMSLKLTALLALGFCLLEPKRRVERPRPGANVMAVVVDNSRSMEIAPAGKAASRRQRLAPWLPSDSAWQTRLAQDFDVRRYAIDNRLHAVADLSQLDFRGTATSLATAIDTLMKRFANRPVAGMLLLTDGLATDGLNEWIASREFAFPIYPIVDTQEGEVRDLRLHDPVVQVSSFELAPVGIEAWVEAVGLAGEELIVRLIDAAGDTIARQSIACNSDDFHHRVRFTFRPREPGFQSVALRASLRRDDRESGPVRSRTEVTLANNTLLIAVDRGSGPYRLLYVSGRPNWEFKFLRRALESDVELRLSALIRIAKQQPKFSFRDRGVPSANPLRAGFDESDDTAEQYDEPVLLRIGVSEGELVAGFPTSSEDLFRYDAVILDDVEASFFSQHQMLLLRQFVAHRGGGLMMLGGAESFFHGGYEDTPVAELLPLYLRPRPTDKHQPARMLLTREGQLEPWLRLRSNQQDENSRQAFVPEFYTWNAIAEVKPGAQTLAELQLAAERQPGIVVQRFGKGRTLALTVGDYWRWSMHRPDADVDDLAQAWRQIARWLTNDVPRRVEVDVQAPPSPVNAHRIIVQVRDENFQPLDNATVSIEITPPDGAPLTAQATPDATQPGVYALEYWCQHDGSYRCVVACTAPDGEPLDPVHTGWTAQPSSVEFARVVPDMQTLHTLAKQSGGQVVALEDLESFVAELPNRRVPQSELREEPLWHQPWMLLIAVLCLCGEWGLRRWKGLP